MNNKKLMNILETAREAAREAAKLSSCVNKKVGCAFMNFDTNEIVSIGYNGAKEPCEKCVRKVFHWQQDGCWAIHAEIRALFYFTKYHNDRLNRDFSRLYAVTTHGPCDQCLKYLHYFGVPLVVYDIPYHNDYSKWEGKIKVLSMEEFLHERTII